MSKVINTIWMFVHVISSFPILKFPCTVSDYRRTTNVNTWTHMITHQDEGSLKAVILIISLTNVDN